MADKPSKKYLAAALLGTLGTLIGSWVYFGVDRAWQAVEYLTVPIFGLIAAIYGLGLIG